MLKNVKKRDGQIVDFNSDKITQAIFKAAESVAGNDIETSEFLTKEVIKHITSETPSVEEIQDIIEKTLIEHGHAKTAKAFILHRAKHTEQREQDTNVPEAIANMFSHKTKLSKLVDNARIASYKNLYYMLKKMQKTGELATHEDYLCGNDLAKNIYHKKYCLKDLKGDLIEKTPEEVFVRLASYIASVETTQEKQQEFAIKFYNDLYNGSYLPGGRVIAGAGDLYRLKTLANCFVTLIEKDNIESIYKAAYDAARTYSYGGGIGIDISNLRPKDSVVHNAADKSTGAVSFMELYSLTTGLIGQSGRRGALMLTLDVKHPDILDFINVKKNPNWVTEQIVKQCEWSNKFDAEQLEEIKNQVRENTQIRFANISIKVSDEFMQAVNEQTTYGKDKILVYKKRKAPNQNTKQDENLHYSHGMPSKQLKNYELYKEFDSFEEANNYLKDEHNVEISESQLKDIDNRDVYGDLVLNLDDYDLAIKYSGDFLLYYNTDNTGEIKNLIKARDVWNLFVISNYKTAEPGIIFWTTMTKYSPSNYVDRPISSTNPCGEVPLEEGGACNLGSINLSRFVKSGYTEEAEIDWEGISQATRNLVRFLDNVISWNQVLNPLKKQRKSAAETRRIGLGYMGIADMLNQLGLPYDSDEGITIMEKVSKFIANVSYEASAELATEKEPCECYDKDKYLRCPFITEALDDHVQEKVKKYGVRNVAVLSIAPTGTISNAVLGFVHGNKNYIGVSGGIEPIFALYYTRRSESFNKSFKVFHSTVQSYIDLKKLNENVQDAKSEEDLKQALPEFFFRTAHHISPEKRVEIQGICQSHIDHSISSTVNLSENINPEIISKVYLDAWEKKLKGITIYRDGSRFPILSVDKEKTEFQEYRSKKFEVIMNSKTTIIAGDEVITLSSGKLTTPFHLLKKPVDNVIVREITDRPSKPGFEVEQEESLLEKKKIITTIDSTGSSITEVENPCPECGAGMRMTEGCSTCPECGHSPCSVKI